MRYFAYGSNMCTNRLKHTVPSATCLFVAKLCGHKLKFHKKSTDGSGKANAYKTAKQYDVVWGVVFEIDSKEKPKLDRREGLGKGYEGKDVNIIDLKGQEHSVFAYIASGSHINDELKPYGWYKTFVLAGAKQHSLPEEYIAAIASQEATRDTDKTRESR